MTAPHTYITTTIPYVNARPHIGFALELVQADVLARFRRGRGENVRFQAGTDDNSLKNVLAAQAAGTPVREFVDRNAEAFLALGEALSLSVDDVIRTSRDPRHRPGVERFWRACADAGDLYRKRYEGLYCTGCEQFYAAAELSDGRCPEHGTEPQPVAEENWFFRLSRYAAPLREAISTGRLRIEPAGRRNEVLAFIDRGLEDFSVSRPAQRAGGWGITVPGDPDQVIYVWFDALCNYVTALGYGTGEDAYRHWWTADDSGGRRIHLLGKGVLRFHAVYWPAMLLSCRQPLPSDIFVHDYLTAGGRRISKSAGPVVAEPAALAGEYGTDAVRWWLLREVPRVGDADFTVERLIARADDELANGLGNLVNRVVAMIHRYRDGYLPGPVTPLTRTVPCRRLGTWTRPAARRPAWPVRRSSGSTSGTRPRRSGRSRTRRTGSLTGSGPGTWPGPNGTATARPGLRSTPRSARCSARARRWATSSGRSCPTPRGASRPSAHRGRTAACLLRARCSGGWRRGLPPEHPGLRQLVSAGGRGQAPCR
jgi:methionyl-tRNA synthetase